MADARGNVKPHETEAIAPASLLLTLFQSNGKDKLWAYAGSSPVPASGRKT
jgi:hypothetical protein